MNCRTEKMDRVNIRQNIYIRNQMALKYILYKSFSDYN